MITRKAAAALAAGCTVVVHPSQETPYSALALAELADQAGLPAGVFNVLPGNAEDIVKPWMSDPRVRAVSFTGSTGIGRLLYSQGAQTVKRLVLELGGHAPFLVFADADLDHAVDQAIAAKFATSGQDCLAANRILIERPVYQAFCEAFTNRVEALSVGPGLEDPDIGPLMHERAIAKQEDHVRDALARGARLLTGGYSHTAGPLFFSRPFWRTFPPMHRSSGKKHLVRWQPWHPSIRRRTPLHGQTTPNMALSPISTRRTRAASTVQAARFNTAWLPSTAQK